MINIWYWYIIAEISSIHRSQSIPIAFSFNSLTLKFPFYRREKKRFRHRFKIKTFRCLALLSVCLPSLPSSQPSSQPSSPARFPIDKYKNKIMQAKYFAQFVAWMHIQKKGESVCFSVFNFGLSLGRLSKSFLNFTVYACCIFSGSTPYRCPKTLLSKYIKKRK